MDRLNRILSLSRQQNFDLLAVVVGSNLFYLTGMSFHAGERLMLALLPTAGGRPAFVLPAMEAPRVRASSAVDFDLHPWDDSQPSSQALSRSLSSMSLNPSARIGVENLSMRVFELHALEQAAPSAHFADAGPLFSELRMVKDDHELETMKEAARMIDASLHALLPQIHAGLTEKQVAALWSREITQAGADGPSFESIVASGPNAANPHHMPTDRRLQKGDLLILDGGARFRGYASDITRTIALGQVSPEHQRIYQTVLAANTAGRSASIPGVTGHQIDSAARQTIINAGLGDQFPHRTGHGLGLDVHEEPYIAPGQHRPLPPGAVFTVEPGVYVEGLTGVRIEDDVVLTPNGHLSLTQFPRELIHL